MKVIDNVKLTKLWNDGATQMEIAHIFRSTEKWIRAYAREIGLPKRSTKEGWPEAMVEVMRERWAAGDSMSEIATLIGATRSAVAGQLRRRGLLRNRSASVTQANIARANALQGERTRKPKPEPKPKVVKMVKPLRAPVMKAVSNHAKNPLGVKAQMTPAALRLAGNGMVFEESAARPACSPAKASAWLPLPGSEPVPMMGLRSGRCKWPMDVPGMDESCFCNLTAIGDRYCTTHAVMSAAPEQPKMRDLVRSVRRIAA